MKAMGDDVDNNSGHDIWVNAYWLDNDDSRNMADVASENWPEEVAVYAESMMLKLAVIVRQVMV